MEYSATLQKTKQIKTFGNSMLPLLQNGDIVYFKKTTFSSIKMFDVIIVYKQQKYFTHRVIHKSQNYLITKGDNNNYSDGKILPTQIVGRVYQIKRGSEIFPIESLSVVQNASYLQEIKKITQLFQKNEIDFVFLKGLPIYLFYTREMPKRIYADCDVLVAEKDFTRSRNLLLKNGYTQKRNRSLVGTYLEPFLMEQDFFAYRNYPIAIDLHKRPFSYIRKLDFPDSLYPKQLMDQFAQELLSTKRWVKVNDIEIPIPQSDYLLIFLCIHFFTHTMKMVHRLWLIKEVIRKDKRSKNSWEDLLEQVETYKVGYMVYPAFYFVNTLYGKTIPQEVVTQVKPVKSTEKIYRLNPNLVFDEKVALSRVVNKLKISWTYSPQPLYKRMRLFFSPSMFLLFLTYIRPLHILFSVDVAKAYRNRLRKIIPAV